MNSEVRRTEDEDIVIELNNIQSSQDVVDASRRQPNVVSFYHSKKSAAEGMMDISLLTANANQLKFILYYNQESKTFYPALILIMLSLVLQVSIGFLLIFRVSFVCGFMCSSANGSWCNSHSISASLQNERSEATSEHCERVLGVVDFSGDDYQHHGGSHHHNRSSIRCEINRNSLKLKCAYQSTRETHFHTSLKLNFSKREKIGKDFFTLARCNTFHFCHKLFRDAYSSIFIAFP